MAENRSFPIIALVVPCFNEEPIIADTIHQLQSELDSLIREKLIDERSFILLIDDGSKDETLAIIRKSASPTVKAIKLAANAGHQNALLAGIHYVTGKVDCMVSLDADLQDDISTLREMIEKFKQGTHIVYGVRRSRKTDSGFKRGTAHLFNRIMRKMGVRVVYNHADYRLLSGRVLQEFGKYKEVNLFLRGIFPRMGFSSAEVYYDRQSRKAGVTKYPLRKMIEFAINGITSFSNVPLKLIAWMGWIVFFISLLLSLWVLIVVITGKNVPGWASITLPIYFLGGIQLLALGIIGEYVSKIYMETKNRPRYHIEEEI